MYFEISKTLLTVVLLFHFCIIIDIESTAVHQINIDDTMCDTSTNYVGDHDIYELVWESEKVPFLCNTWFKGGPSGEYDDEYKVCVKPSEWVIKDCNVKVNYYFGFNSRPAKTFSCNGSPTEVCSGPKEYLKIALRDNTTLGGFYPGSKFRLTITSYKTFDYFENLARIGGIVGGVIGAIVLLVIIGVFVCICICNRKGRRSRSGHVFNPGQSGQTNMAMSSVAVTHTGQSLPVGAYPRQQYPTQQYQTHQNPTQQYPAAQQPSQNNVSTSGL